MGLNLIPCPVCGGELSYGHWPLLDGEGLTPLMVDCGQRCHARTEPQVYEVLRLRCVLAEAEKVMAELSESPPV